jgi:DNA-binding LacI/PurR family transcriptional regulator
VPDAISIVGFDDLGLTTTPRLATVRVDFHRTGTIAAETLFRLMAGEPEAADGCVIPVELVLRGSMGPPKKN